METTPVSMSTETSAICTPAEPSELRPAPSVRPLNQPIAAIDAVPSFRQASFHVRLLAGDPFTWILPSAASSCSGWAPNAGAAASNSFARAFTADLRVEVDTPPTVLDPPDAPSDRKSTRLNSSHL